EDLQISNKLADDEYSGSKRKAAIENEKRLLNKSNQEREEKIRHEEEIKRTIEDYIHHVETNLSDMSVNIEFLEKERHRMEIEEKRARERIAAIGKDRLIELGFDPVYLEAFPRFMYEDNYRADIPSSEYLFIATADEYERFAR